MTENANAKPKYHTFSNQHLREYLERTVCSKCPHAKNGELCPYPMMDGLHGMENKAVSCMVCGDTARADAAEARLDQATEIARGEIGEACGLSCAACKAMGSGEKCTLQFLTGRE